MSSWKIDSAIRQGVDLRPGIRRDERIGGLTRRAVLASVLAAGVTPRALAQDRPIIIPIASDFAHLMIKARIGPREVWAGLDNGAETTMVDAIHSSADRDELGRVRFPLSASAGAPPPPTFVELDAVRIAAAGVGDLAGPSISDEVPIGAVIGMELFERKRVEIDFVARTVTLRAPAETPPPGGRAVPLIASTHKKHLVMVAVEDAPPFRAVLDLGCSRPMLIHTPLAERLGLLRGRTVSTNLAHGINGNDRKDFLTRTASLSRLSFAGRTFADVPIEVGDIAYARVEAEALLGLTVLRRFDLTFNLASDQLWVRDTPRIADVFGRRTIGLQVEPAGQGLRITHVAAGSPGEKAGFKAGEVITAIDGRAATPAALRTALAGQTLSFTLVDGKLRNLTAARFD